MRKLAAGVARQGAPAEAVLSRLRIPLMARASLGWSGRSEEALAVDLGLRGVFVERSEPLPLGQRVRVSFRLPGNELPVSALCRVAWRGQAPAGAEVDALPAGLGLEFERISAADAGRVRGHVLAYLARHPRARRFHAPWPEPAGAKEGR